MVLKSKKSSTSRLTASRKKRVRPARKASRLVRALDALSELADCHYRLAALAGLLEACGEPMEAGQVASAGTLMAEQVRRLEEMMRRLDAATRR
jgi:hypothetical protein